MKAAEEAEENTASARTDRRMALGRKNRAEDKRTEFGENYRKVEKGEDESDGFFKALARIGVERSYVRRDEGFADGAQADIHGDKLP